MMRNMHGRPNEKGDIRTALPRMTEYLRSSMGVIVFALVLAALSAVMTIIGPDKIGSIATIMSDGLTTGIDLNAIAKVGIFLAVLYVLSALFSFTQHYIMSVVTLKMSYRMRGELSEKINRVPQKYFNTTSQGDILSRITNDVSTLQPAPHHQRRHSVCGLSDHDVRHRMAAGVNLAGGNGCRSAGYCADHVQISAVLCRSSAKPWRTERLRGGNGERPEDHQGLRTRGGLPSALP